MMVYFILYIFFEVMLTSTISSEIGGLITFIEIIVSAIVGIFILKNFSFSLIEKINSVRQGYMTQEEFVKSSIGSAFGALLLIAPGFLTDIVGLLLQFNFFTILLSRTIKFQPKRKKSMDQKFNHNDDIIDIEVIDKNN